MSTIKELLEGRELPVNVCCNDPLLKDIYYTITHKDEHCVLATGYCKENNIKITDSFMLLRSENWELYIEPKKKVKVALYAYKPTHDKNWYLTSNFYKDDDRFIIKGPFQIGSEFKRLDWSEIEVNDE